TTVRRLCLNRCCKQNDVALKTLKTALLDYKVPACTAVCIQLSWEPICFEKLHDQQLLPSESPLNTSVTGVCLELQGFCELNHFNNGRSHCLSS
ncbi:MAG: hypothetical protein ABR572_09790, partial [Cryomorphaceae bacterium]